MEGVVFVPVPWEQVGEVRALLERLKTKEGPASVEETTEQWTRDELRRFYEDCSQEVRQILLKLAEHPDDWVYGTELVKVADPTGQHKNVGSYLGSLTATARRLGRPHEWPMDAEKDEHRRLSRYRMHRRVADIILSFGGSVADPSED